MSSPTVQNINTSRLDEEQQNGLAILSHLSVDDLNQIKTALKLSGPGIIGPQTLDAFVALAGTLGIDLTNAGVNAFKDAHQLGNSGALAGVIGAQTASFYAEQINSALQAAQTSGTRKINQAGLEIVKESEGYARLIPGSTSVRAYPDPGTGGDPWTIGYGHTGSDVFPGVVFTQAQAEAALLSDLAGAQSDVSAAVTVPLNDNEFSALVSFTFNVGGPQLDTSTLLHLLNQGDRQAAADQFLRWVNGGNGPLPGLVTRRNAERALFLQPV
ncbi:MAG: lysozyme [Candidatus Eremiobacteraeota bacterium]|jgi:GH24 family phage-related lysozyme (muramidase)|nr:lysozyme [Candidatus Eremiobacteraeota bacterium]